VLLALSDGMGGHQAGEVASALVLESLQQALRDQPQGPVHEQLERAVERANRTVLSAAEQANRRGMGATLTALFVRGAEAYIAEVGDSRGYLLRNGRLRQITRDQSLVQLLIDHGVITPQEARRSTQKNLILQAVGLSAEVRVAIARLELRRGDRFLLCSDGISNAISDDELRQILIDSDPRAACETMIALANDRGGDDNQTAIVCDVRGDGLDPPDEFETVTSTYEVLKAYEATVEGRPVGIGDAHVVAAAIGAAPAEPAADGVPTELDAEPPDPTPPPAAAAASTPAPATAARSFPMWILIGAALIAIAVAAFLATR
jgi:serine/threonine protein phosphatase PrpC